jgi:hypothetical protein
MSSNSQKQENTKSKNGFEIDIKTLASKKQLVISIIGTDKIENEIKDKKTYFVKKFLQQYNLATEKEIKDNSSNFEKEKEELFFETAVENKDGLLTYTDNIPNTNKEQGKIRSRKLHELVEKSNTSLESKKVWFEPVICKEEKILNTIDEFTKEELKGYLF